MAAPGQLLSHFRLEKEIGRGGMGVVYRARDEHLERDVAVKVLAARLLDEPAAGAHFRREALALSRLNHPNIATVYDFDTDGDTDFLVMEYVPGVTMTKMAAQGPLDESDVTRLGVQLAEGLTAAHERGIVHRDLKPGNLRVTDDGRLKILDFGLAKLLRSFRDSTATETWTRGVVGTVPYMAPEQLSGGAADARADVYAAGCVLYELSTGRRPFPQKDTGELLHAITHRTPPAPSTLNPSISADLEAVLLKALAKEPAKRYPTARDLAEDLRRLAAGIVVEAPRRSRIRRRRWGLAGAAALLALLAILVAIDASNSGRERSDGKGTTRIESLAVLPLENLSGDPEQDYFADGMTEDLIIEFGRIAPLTVIARWSVMRFKGPDLPPLSDVASELGVDALIVGTVQRTEERVRITAHLFDAARGETIWSDRFDRELRDVLTLRAEVARSVAHRIQVVLPAREEQRLARSRRVDPEAHRMYLLGRHYFNRFDREGVAKAITTLEEAVAIDPDFAEAWASLSRARFVSSYHYSDPIWTGIEDARKAALTALTLDETLAEANMTLGLIRQFHDWDYAGAEAAHQAALRHQPSDAYAHAMYAFVLSSLRRHDEATAEGRLAVELDPLSPLIGAFLAELHLGAREYHLALSEVERILDLEPGFPRATALLLWIHEATEDYGKAVAAFEKFPFVEVTPAEYEELRNAYEESGATGYWQWQVGFWEERGRAYAAARAQSALGHRDAAFESLDKAVENRHGNLALVETEPQFDSLRDDPRFDDLLDRLNLAGAS